MDLQQAAQGDTCAFQTLEPRPAEFMDHGQTPTCQCLHPKTAPQNPMSGYSTITGDITGLFFCEMCCGCGKSCLF